MAEYGIWCTRHKESIAGFAEAWLKHDGVLVKFDDYHLAQARAEIMNKEAGKAKVSYKARLFTTPVPMNTKSHPELVEAQRRAYELK